MSEFTGSFFIGGSNSLELIFSSKKDLSANMIIVVDSDLSIFQSKIDMDKTPKFAHIGKERMIVAVEMSGIYIYNIKNNHLKFSQLDWMCKKSKAKKKAIQRLKSEIDIVHMIRSNMVMQ